MHRGHRAGLLLVGRDDLAGAALPGERSVDVIAEQHGTRLVADPVLGLIDGMAEAFLPLLHDKGQSAGHVVQGIGEGQRPGLAGKLARLLRLGQTVKVSSNRLHVGRVDDDADFLNTGGKNLLDDDLKSRLDEAIHVHQRE